MGAVRAASAPVFNMLVDDDLLTTPSIAVDLHFSSHFVSVTVNVRASSPLGAFREAAAPDYAQNDANKAYAEAHEEGNDTSSLPSSTSSNALSVLR